MVETRIYHGITLDIVRAASRKICYIILPEGLKDAGRKWTEDLAARFSSNIVIISGMNWNDDLTPWEAGGVFRKAKPFGGKAGLFLKDLIEDTIPNVEISLGMRHAERYLLGISLSGLFALWSIFKCNEFEGVGSISGSLWYDGFVQWAEDRTVPANLRKVFVSLGDKEKRSKERRLASVEGMTIRFVEIIREKGVDVEFIIEENTTHFSPVEQRFEKAIEYLLNPEENTPESA